MLKAWQNIAGGKPWKLCVKVWSDSNIDSFVEILESFVERSWMVDIKMKIDNLAQTAVDTIVERA